MFYTQIDSIRERESTQASLLVIFENFENYLGQTWEYLEQNWIFFEQIWRFCRAAVKARATKWRRGILYNNLNNIYRQVVGMHSIYLVVKEFRGCFKGKFWRSIVLLFHFKALYLSVLKSLVHMYEKWQMNRMWLTQIYLYRWYIPDLIRLANDIYIETNPFPAVVDNIDSSKTICASYSSSNILSSLSNRQFC